MKKCTNEKYLYEIPDGCQREVTIGCGGCPDYKEEPVDAYAIKYKECQICGAEANTTYISQEDGLCQSCRANEEYYEHEQRVSGGDQYSNEE